MYRTCCTIISSSGVIRPLVSQYAAAISGLDRQAAVRFFPHEIADLAVALEFAQVLNQDRAQNSSILWSTQYVTLLWISLICMIPFDLAQFDEAGREGQTATTIEAIAKRGLTNSGIVRESAAILLSRLYVRYHNVQRRLSIKLNPLQEGCAAAPSGIFGLGQNMCERAERYLRGTSYLSY